MRNGQRWRVTRLNPDNNRLIARRLDDNTLGAFTNDYVHQHITHGYTVTVHSAQGVTADTTHAVLSETATRAMSYVAMTRGRDANTAYLYEQTTEHEYQHDSTELGHVMQRGSRQHAAKLLRAIVTNDDHLLTAHGLAAATGHTSLPAHVRDAIEHRTAAIRHRTANYERRRAAAVMFDNSTREARSRELDRARSIDDDEPVAGGDFFDIFASGECR
ncbi:MAG: hypothetical protein P4L48_07025 [Mycobacterium sp.]|nr:hypothetical protein [Mycobacterium sp.]